MSKATRTAVEQLQHQFVAVGGFANAPQLHSDGYALLRGAIPSDWLSELRTAFDRGVRPSDQWPVPRGADWRHA